MMAESSVLVDGHKAGIGISELPGCVVISLRGDHDLATKPQLVAALTPLRSHPAGSVVIDLRQCTFLDSTIIGAILTARGPDASQEPLVSVVLPDDSSYVCRALSVVGLRGLMPAHLSIEAALEAAPAVGRPFATFGPGDGSAADTE
jgi:anti-anti-sigma factor